MPIWDYFVFSHVPHLLLSVFQNLFWLRRNQFFNNPSKPFLMIIVGFVISKNVSISDTSTRDIVPILDSSKSLDGYIRQVSFVALPSLVYSNNDIKAEQTGGRFSALQLLSLPIIYATIFLAGDTRRELDLTITDFSVVQSPSLNAFSILVSKSKAKEKKSGLTFCWPTCKTF